MKKNFAHICLVICYSIVAFSCNDNSDMDNSAVELKLSGSVEGMEPSESLSLFQGGQTVGVWLSTKDVSDSLVLSDKACNVRFSQSAAGLVSEPRTFWNSNEIFLYCYSPYRADVVNPNIYEFVIDNRQDTLVNSVSNDILWAKTETQYSGEKININFRHLLSKVIVNVRSTSPIPGSFENSDVSILNTLTHSVIDFGDGSILGGGSVGAIAMSTRKNLPLGYEASKEALVIPQKLKEGTPLFSIRTLSGNKLEWVADKDVEFESGKSLLINVTIDEGDCDVQIQTIQNWIYSDEVIEGIAVESLPTYKVYDYYDRKGIKGIVIGVNETGQHGWICSLDEAELVWCTEKEYWKLSVNSYDKNDSYSNMQNIIKADSTLKLYPAAKWCNDKNTNGVKGWVLPASNVMIKYFYPIVQYNFITRTYNNAEFNEAIRKCPVDASQKNEVLLSTDIELFAYWVSTLSGTDMVRCIGGYPAYTQYQGYDSYASMEEFLRSQDEVHRVRAFHEF